MKPITLLVLAAASLMAQPQTANVSVGGKSQTITILPRSVVSFSLSSATTEAGTPVTLDLSLSTSRKHFVSWQIDFVFDPARVSAISASPGPTTTAAGKTLDCNTVSPGRLRCIVNRDGNTAIGNGVGVRLSVTASASTIISLEGAVATMQNPVTARPLNTAIVPGGGIVTVPEIQTVACDVVQLEPGEETYCSVSMSIAPTADRAWPITGDAPLVVPASVTIPANQTSQQFLLSVQP